MKLKNIFAILAAVATLVLAGCEEKQTEGGKATFALEQSELNIGAEGGAQSVKYTITNPQSGAVVLSNCTENWIKNLSTATYGAITFTVAPNYKMETREAKITVEYTGVEAQFEILVKQAASDKEFFTFEVTENKPTSLTLNIEPADVGTAYICQIHTKEFIETFGLEDDFALTSNDMKCFENEAYYMGQTTLNYLQNISHTGRAFDVKFDGLIPNTDYVVYSYHIDLTNGYVSSDVYRENIRTADSEMLEVSFDMAFEISGAQIKQTITPSDQEAYYYIGYMSVSDFYSYYGSSADMATTFVAKWNENVSIKTGMAYYPSQIIAEYGKQGTRTFEYTELKANTEYVFYVFALNPDTAYAASEIVLEKVSTNDVVESGMTITIEAKDIYATTANVYWTASDPNGKFARSVFTRSEFDNLGSTDEQRFKSIAAKDYWFYTATGSTDMNLVNLIPDTEYVAFAYGLDGETPNTKIFTTTFRTKSNVAGSSDIQISWDTHYNLAEAAEADPEHWGSFAGWDDYALIPATISGVEPTDEIYWTLTQFPTDYYNYDDEWIRDLTSNDFFYHEQHSNTYFQLPYEKDYSLIAVAKDANGNFGKLLKVEIYLYASDSADISSYVYVEEN